MQSASEKTPAAKSVCKACGTRLLEVLSTGVLGCPACYRAFYSALYPLTKKERDGAKRLALRKERE